MMYNVGIDPVKQISLQGIFITQIVVRKGRFASYLNPCDCNTGSIRPSLSDFYIYE